MCDFVTIINLQGTTRTRLFLFSCFSAERDFYLDYVSDGDWTSVLDDQRYGCDEIFYLLYDAILGGTKETLLAANGIYITLTINLCSSAHPQLGV